MTTDEKEVPGGRHRERPQVLVQQVVLTDYRLGFHRMLSLLYGREIPVVCGRADFDPSTRSVGLSDEEAEKMVERARNQFLLGRRLLWQSGRVRQLCATDLAILNFNTRILSNWWILLNRKLSGRKTLLWGHVSGRSRMMGWIGRWQVRMAHGFLCYTKAQQAQFQKRNPRTPSWVAANGCLNRESCRPELPEPGARRTVLFVGRLVERKKPMLLLHGFAEAVAKETLGNHLLLEFVGEGPERDALQKEVAELGLAEQVRFFGHVSEPAELRAHYARAAFSVSPGYVGLSAIQSFAHGVTMLVAKDEPHSPEIEACIEGKTARYFPSDDPAALGTLLSESMNDVGSFDARRQEICQFARENYSFEAMANSFLEAIESTFGIRSIPVEDQSESAG